MTKQDDELTFVLTLSQCTRLFIWSSHELDLGKTLGYPNDFDSDKDGFTPENSAHSGFGFYF